MGGWQSARRPTEPFLIQASHESRAGRTTMSCACLHADNSSPSQRPQTKLSIHNMAFSYALSQRVATIDQGWGYQSSRVAGQSQLDLKYSLSKGARTRFRFFPVQSTKTMTTTKTTLQRKVIDCTHTHRGGERREHMYVHVSVQICVKFICHNPRRSRSPVHGSASGRSGNPFGVLGKGCYPPLRCSTSITAPNICCLKSLDCTNAH